MHEKLCSRVDLFLKLASDITPEEAKEILKLEDPFTAEELKTAWHKAVLKYHPDTGSAKDKEKLTAKFIEANKAYELLLKELGLGKSIKLEDPDLEKSIQFLRDLKKAIKSNEKPPEVAIVESEGVATPVDKPIGGITRIPFKSPYSKPKGYQIGTRVNVKASVRY
jgi:curved DNA-binding protein CbpA